jgi:diguanylate cyclase (GGDEF)-like protein/PAS domain S-box-containing protein
MVVSMSRIRNLRLELRDAAGLAKLPWRGGTGTSSAPWARAAASMGVLLAVYASWQVFHWAPSSARQLIANAFFYVVTGVAVWTAWSASRRSSRSPRLRRAWRLFALALFAQLAGQVAFQVYGLLGEKPYPSIADAIYLCFYPLMLAGLLALPAATGHRGSRLRLAVDLAVVAIGGSAAVVYLVLGPTVVVGGESALQVGFSVAYPAGDMVLVVGLASVLMRGSAASARWALRLLVAGVVLFVVGDLVYGYVTLHSSYQSGDAIDTAWIVALALMAIAGTTQRASDDGEAIATTRESVGWLPPAAVAFGFGILLFSLRGEPLFPGFVMVVIAIVLAGLVLARQMLVQRDLVHAQDQLRYQALHDALTGLPNRTLVLERAQHLLASARRSGRWVPALFLDLDGFKGVNDTLGHAVGDKLLQTVATRLQNVVREGDTVGRLGGDEFVILLDPAALTTSPELVADRVLDAVREPIELDGAGREPLSITASVGIAIGPHASPNELLLAADVALYRAKAAGKNRFVRLEAAHEMIAEIAGAADASLGRSTLETQAMGHGHGLSDGFFRALADRSFELLMVGNADRTVRWVNATFERVLGYAPGSLMGRNLLLLFHPDDLPGLVETISRLGAVAGASGAVDARIRAADGSWHLMEIAATNLFGDPALGGFVVSMRHVTGRRRLEVVPQESETRYGEVVDGARDAVWTADLAGSITTTSPASSRAPDCSVSATTKLLPAGVDGLA